FFILGLVLIAEKLRRTLVWPLLILAGWTNLIFHTAVLSPNDLRTLISDNTEIVVVRGTLAESPKTRIIERNGDSFEYSLTPLQASGICRGQVWQPAFGKIIVSAPAPLSDQFFAGQPVEITGVISRPPPPLAE